MTKSNTIDLALVLFRFQEPKSSLIMGEIPLKNNKLLFQVLTFQRAFFSIHSELVFII